MWLNEFLKAKREEKEKKRKKNTWQHYLRIANSSIPAENVKSSAI